MSGLRLTVTSPASRCTNVQNARKSSSISLDLVSFNHPRIAITHGDQSHQTASIVCKKRRRPVVSVMAQNAYYL